MRHNTTDDAVACSLGSIELAQRRIEARELLDDALDCQELSDGFELRFSGDDATVRRLADFILQERRCCRFLRFRLTCEPAGGSVRLTLGGSRQAKDFLKAMMAGHGAVTGLILLALWGQ